MDDLLITKQLSPETPLENLIAWYKGITARKGELYIGTDTSVFTVLGDVSEEGQNLVFFATHKGFPYKIVFDKSDVVDLDHSVWLSSPTTGKVYGRAAIQQLSIEEAKTSPVQFDAAGLFAYADSLIIADIRTPASRFHRKIDRILGRGAAALVLLIEVDSPNTPDNKDYVVLKVGLTAESQTRLDFGKKAQSTVRTRADILRNFAVPALSPSEYAVQLREGATELGNPVSAYSMALAAEMNPLDLVEYGDLDNVMKSFSEWVSRDRRMYRLGVVNPDCHAKNSLGNQEGSVVDVDYEQFRLIAFNKELITTLLESDYLDESQKSRLRVVIDNAPAMEMFNHELAMLLEEWQLDLPWNKIIADNTNLLVSPEKNHTRTMGVHNSRVINPAVIIGAINETDFEAIFASQQRAKILELMYVLKLPFYFPLVLDDTNEPRIVEVSAQDWDWSNPTTSSTVIESNFVRSIIARVNNKNIPFVSLETFIADATKSKYLNHLHRNQLERLHAVFQAYFALFDEVFTFGSTDLALREKWGINQTEILLEEIQKITSGVVTAEATSFEANSHQADGIAVEV